MNRKTYLKIILLLLMPLILLYLYIRFYDCTIFSTIMANLFGGLITGLIIFLVGNKKSKIIFNNIEISNHLEEIERDINEWLRKVDIFLYYSNEEKGYEKELKADECYVDWQDIYNKLCFTDLNKYYKKNILKFLQDSNILEVNLIKENLENSYNTNVINRDNINLEEFKKTLKVQRLEMRKLNQWINSEILRYKSENKKLNNSIV